MAQKIKVTMRQIVGNLFRCYSVKYYNKNLAIANRARVSCAHNTSRASIGLITP